MMSKLGIRRIRTERAYAKALARIEALMDRDRADAESEEFRALVNAVVAYEERHFPKTPPSPADAIKFRMEQAGKSPRDLVPIFGNLAKTTEVLKGKRDLTMKMIRALHENLGVHPETLTPDGKGLPEMPAGIDFDRSPVAEMAKRGWIDKAKNLKDRAEEIMRELADCAGGWDALPKALFRQGKGARANEKTDQHALRAWCLHILCQARLAGIEGIYRDGAVNPTFLRELAQLSLLDEGPILAKMKLAERGIAMVVARHLPGTYLDGAALWTIENVPVVGMTTRHDRLDNFWFCLLHELAHIGRHFSNGKSEVFFDDLQLNERYGRRDDEREREADDWAQEALIPSEIWNDHATNVDSISRNVHSLAQSAGVHPAIASGRIRHELDNYQILSGLVGLRKVRAILMRESA